MAQVIVPAEAKGAVLASSEGLSFWGGVDPASGKVWNSYLRKGGGKTLTSQLLFRFARPLPPVRRNTP